MALTASFEMAGGLVLGVADTGKGMTVDEIIVALEPFGQVQSAMARDHGGTGLGSPVVRHLVELHGGNLKGDSHKGQGTTVTVTIPPKGLLSAFPRGLLPLHKCPAAAFSTPLGVAIFNLQWDSRTSIILLLVTPLRMIPPTTYSFCTSDGFLSSANRAIAYC
jgi:hypothetical protein